MRVGLATLGDKPKFKHLDVNTPLWLDSFLST